MSEPLWTGLSLVAALDAYVLGSVAGPVGGVSIDTRSLQPGDLFFAIAGANRNGHDYVRAAFEKGASAAVVDEPHSAALREAGPLYVVADVLGALERLGAAARARTSARIVAVTGSVGKTSTKEALRLALGEERTHASQASYNNHWGAPLTLARMPKDAAFGVFELGMNHAGEIAPLAALVRPHVAVITTIAPVHLENFDSLEAIADAKAEIFSGLVPDGAAILHRDVPQFQRLRERARAHGARVFSFGRTSGAPDACRVWNTRRSERARAPCALRNRRAGKAFRDQRARSSSGGARRRRRYRRRCRHALSLCRAEGPRPARAPAVPDWPVYAD